MESDWRYTPFNIGWGGNIIAPFTGKRIMRLAAELITPFLINGFLCKWIGQINDLAGSYGVYCLANPLFPDQSSSYLGPILSPGPFPYGFTVVPDV